MYYYGTLHYAWPETHMVDIVLQTKMFKSHTLIIRYYNAFTLATLTMVVRVLYNYDYFPITYTELIARGSTKLV